MKNKQDMFSALKHTSASKNTEHYADLNLCMPSSAHESTYNLVTRERTQVDAVKKSVRFQMAMLHMIGLGVSLGASADMEKSVRFQKAMLE